jgi:phospholipase C
MSKLRILVSAIVVLATGGILVNLDGCGGGSNSSTTPPPPPGKIQHVVVIFQENRTPDNLFQDPVLYQQRNPPADILQSGMNSLGKTIPLTPIDLGTTGANPQNYDLSHSHTAFVSMYDGGKMDGANLIGCSPAANCPPNAHPNPQFMYVNPSDVQPYFALAEQYTFADRMFQTNQGPSMPAHQFIISGTSAPSTGSNLFASENPNNPTKGSPDAGCDAPAGYTVTLIDPTGNEKSNAPIYPCFEHQTLTDLLEAHGNSWRYYTSSGYAGGTGLGLWVGPEAIQHICLPLNASGACNGSDWTNHVVLDQTQILTDIPNHQLPDVSWVIPSGQASDHAGPNDGSGPSWVASVVNAIGDSSYWANTAIFITWDDWGGWYDHVPPPQVLANCAQFGCGYIYGFRVPLIVVSPYAKAQYISKTQHDFGSILKFIETTFSLPSLGYADAAADDFSDCFDFNQTPLQFHTIAAPLNAQYFLNDKTPPTDPDDD